MTSNFKEISPGCYLIPKEAGMRVPGLIVASETLMAKAVDERAVDQVKNVAYLPGIVGYSVAMPDIHWGYGFPIGGVAATDIETGVISPGGVGYDINCGVRLALVPELYKNLSKDATEKLLTAIFHKVPSGVGHGHRGKYLKLGAKDTQKVLETGSKWSVEQGYGIDGDLEHTESNGSLEEADADAVSNHAKERGQQQLGTIGSGNHFIEIGEVDEILDPTVAQSWNVQKGQIYVLIHTGSRGFGHQVCQDTLNHFVKKGYAEGLPDRQLVAAPYQSDDGQRYFRAMCAAANFAFNNRQQVLHEVREAFKEVLNMPAHDVRLLYDVCHNIAKVETHVIDGQKRRLCVHRKGATRAYGPKAPELASIFQPTGQPVIVPGDMGRCSYLMVGQGNPITFSSACHGAGRAMSRKQSMKHWKGRDTVAYMKQQGVRVMATSGRTIAEEMPQAYKDVSDVVEATQTAGLANIVARLRPYLVIKG